MYSIISVLWSLIRTFLIVGIIIFFHELGHFLAAKKLGITVERFSIGFGPRLTGFTRGGTEYRISWIPIFGGYVKMLGENPNERPVEGAEETEEELKEPEAGRFDLAPVHHRAIVAASGSVMNVIFAVFAIALAYMIGMPSYMAPNEDTTIGYVRPHSPASRAGMIPGDKLLSISGYKVRVWTDISENVAISPDKELEMVVLRNGSEEITLRATPERLVRLFGIDRLKFQSDLDSGIISENLRQELARKGLPISQNAMVRIEEPDGRQLIVDEDNEEDNEENNKYEYLVKEEEDKLGIYVETKYGLLGVAAAGRPVIGSVEGDSPADKAGFQPDDVIVAVNQVRIEHSIEFEEQLGDITDKAITLTVERGENTIVMPLELEYNEDGRLISLGGISFGKLVRLNPISALIKAVPETVRLGGKIFQFLKRLIIGDISRKWVAGPIGIVQITMLMLKTGVASTIHFAGMLSINLGIVNMLPLIITDGAMIVFLIVEGLRGKPMKRKRQMMIQQVGLVFIVLLFVFLLYNDIARWITGSF